LDKAMSMVEGGQDNVQDLDKLGTGEIKTLMHRFVSMAKAVSQARRDLESKVQERTAALEKLTRIDPMTELLNRRGMLTRLESELQRAQREGSRLGILWLDVDRFKDINDQFGHAVGDQAIKVIARLIEQTVRTYDAVSRWGGDEFLVLLPQANQISLDVLGERLRSEVEQCTAVTSDTGEVIRLSVSVGGHLQEADDTIDAMLRRGDQALFSAKAQQRNTYKPSVAIEQG
jgi:diguanylate cyclase (GGDEF)-like protein